VSKLAREGSAWVAKGILASRPAGHVGEWFPDTVLALIRQGVLRGVSVGFIERESRPPTRKDVEMFGDEVHRVVSKWDLLEFSVVSIPNNPDALIGEVSMKSARRPVRVTVEPSLRSRIKSEIARLRSRV
jgi:phage head maturation protease